MVFILHTKLNTKLLNYIEWPRLLQKLYNNGSNANVLDTKFCGFRVSDPLSITTDLCIPVFLKLFEIPEHQKIFIFFFFLRNLYENYYNH